VIETVIPAPIQPAVTRLQPAGKHFFGIETPYYLDEKLAYPYMVLALFKMNRPTGGSSLILPIRVKYREHLQKELSHLVEATYWLESKLKGWKQYSSQTAPVLIAQAEDLLRYMKQEPGSSELHMLRDYIAVASKLTTSRKSKRKQLSLLMNYAIELVHYFDSLDEEEYDQHAMYGDLLIGDIAERLNTTIEQLTTSLRGITAKR
jgi:hypothetical protein